MSQETLVVERRSQSVEKMHTLDPSARLVSTKGGLTLKGGILMETEKGEPASLVMELFHLHQ